jgi:hypothetical protein
MTMARLHGKTSHRALAGIDPWDHCAAPIEVVQQRFSIPPRGRKPEYPDPAVIQTLQKGPSSN